MAISLQYFDTDNRNRQPWICHVCTFKNDWKTSKCQMCVTERKIEDDYTKVLEDKLLNTNTENEELRKQVDLKDEQNFELQLEVQKLKEQIQLLHSQLNEQKNRLKNMEAQQKNEFNVQLDREEFEISVSESEKKQKEPDVQNKIKMIYKGYMLKKSKFNSEYKKLWFSLYSNNILSVYQNEMSVSDLDVLGEINLYSVSEIKVEENNRIFHLITNKRTHSFCVQDNNDFNIWFNILKLRIFPKIICEGWLYKKKERNKSWNLRYFILCEVIDYCKHYEIRYYEDENFKKYKGSINCNDVSIKDLTFLPNTYKLQQYGKDLLLELITRKRAYVFAAQDIKSKCLWHDSLKKLSEMPRISHARSASNSMTIPSIPSKNNNAKANILKKNRLSINLEPIQEQNAVEQSANNDNIQRDEWGDCYAALSPQLDSSDDEFSYNPSTMSPTVTVNNEMPEPSYMSQNTEMLMDMNIHKGIEIDAFDEFDKNNNIDNELSMRSEANYAESVNDNQCDTIIHAPFNFNPII